VGASRGDDSSFGRFIAGERRWIGLDLESELQRKIKLGNKKLPGLNAEAGYFDSLSCWRDGMAGHLESRLTILAAWRKLP
jgi:hypothetical protein